MKRILSLCLVSMLLLGLLGTTALAEAQVPEIEIMMSPWVASPMPDYEDDPYNQFLNDTYGAKFTLNATTEFNTELLLRFASDNAPDIIGFESIDQLNTLYEQGVLIDDWTPYADQLSATMGNLTDLAKQFFTKDGKMIAMPTKAGSQLWSFHIRDDWMKALGLAAPESPEDILEIMRAFTQKDPDGNGENDTYGFTAAGGGTGVGELRQLLLLFSAPTFYVEDGKVSHPILSGAFKTYLDFAKTIVDEGLIDPDWYTQGWNERKPNLFQGKFGLVWYPSEALLTETNEGRGSDGSVLNMYDIMEMPSGKLRPNSIIGVVRSVSAACAADPAKMEVICKLFEDTALPNPNYYKLRYGYEIDGFIMKDLGGATYINKLDASEFHACTNARSDSFPALWNWGRLIASYADGYLGGADEEPDAIVERIGELNAKWATLDKYAQDYMLLSPDPTVQEESNRIISEFEINYILGNDTNYDGFVEQWKSVAGETLLADAEETFKAYGLLK